MFRVWLVFTAIMAAGFAIYAAFRDYPVIAVSTVCLVPLVWWVIKRVRNLLLEREIRQVRTMLKSGKF